jgi:ABC-2 type transport system ATP-binding protein
VILAISRVVLEVRLAPDGPPGVGQPAPVRRLYRWHAERRRRAPGGHGGMLMATEQTVASLAAATKRYGSVTALDAVDLEVRAGEVLGLLGPNGAGKTTAVNLIAGLRKPDAGTVELFGRDPRTPGARERLGVTPQETGMPEVLRVGELVAWTAAHFPRARPAAELLAAFGLADLARRQFGALSGGQKRRLTVALAFAGDPDLVLLDEPTTGLDVTARRVLWSAIREAAAAGKTIVLTSHYLEEIEALADRVVVMDHGRVLADGSLADIRGLVGLSRVAARVAGEPDLAALPHVARAETREGRLELLSDDADSLMRALVEQRVPFAELEVRPASLEEAFLALTEPQRRAVG